MECSDELWEQISYVQMSKNRKQVLQALAESETPLIPSALSDRLEVAFNSASRAVRELDDKEMVECLNPDSPRYRRYRLTDTGREVINKVQEIEQVEARA